jgi:hypothetical protein
MFHYGKEVLIVIKDFVVSVIAGVVAYYLCKWLDGR